MGRQHDFLASQSLAARRDGWRQLKVNERRLCTPFSVGDHVLVSGHGVGVDWTMGFSLGHGGDPLDAGPASSFAAMALFKLFRLNPNPSGNWGSFELIFINALSL